MNGTSCMVLNVKWALVTHVSALMDYLHTTFVYSGSNEHTIMYAEESVYLVTYTLCHIASIIRTIWSGIIPYLETMCVFFAHLNPTPISFSVRSLGTNTLYSV